MTHIKGGAMNKEQIIREVIQLYRSPRTNRPRKNEIAATPSTSSFYCHANCWFAVSRHQK